MTTTELPSGSTAAVPDALGHFGRFGGRFVPEALIVALDQLDAEFRAAMVDPSFHAELDGLLAYVHRSAEPAHGVPPLRRRGRRGPGAPQARGPQPHRLAQDQQRARPGAAHRPHGQDARHRRDRRRPARRRHRHRGGAARPRVRGLHGRGGHPPSGAQRRPHEAARRRGRARHRRQPHAQGRDERGHARLGHERREHPLPDRHGRRAGARSRRWCASSRRSSASRPARRSSSSSAACPTPSPRASAAAPTRSACSPASSTTRASRCYGYEAGGDGVETGRHAATITGGGDRRAARHPLLRPAGRRRPDHRVALDQRRPRLPRASGPSTPTSPRSAARTTRRSPTPRPWTPSGSCASPRASSRRSRPPTPSRARCGWAASSAPTRVIVVSCSGRGDKDVETASRWFGVLEGERAPEGRA